MMVWVSDLEYVKPIKVSALKAILEELPQDLEVFPNPMHNLTVCSRTKDGQPFYRGFIDFLGEGKLDMYKDAF